MRFGIIGNSSKLNHALQIAMQVAQTDLTVLITGESGTGKEVFAQMIHSFSARKHNNFIAVNCGAIPQGTIDSELFGHEKGAFTGAHEKRKGYFDVVNQGTIFLDEVADLPLSTQVRLLRVLETGEFIKVGSSKVQKTDVRVIAATNVNINEAIKKSEFREDLFYRLNTVPIEIPPLRTRGEDIFLLFMKFATDFAEKYQMPAIKLTPEAKELMLSYSWPGNVRQLKNITEQISIVESDRTIDYSSLKKYLKGADSRLPAVIDVEDKQSYSTEREILFKFLYDIKKELDETKKAVNSLLRKGDMNQIHSEITEKDFDFEHTIDDTIIKSNTVDIDGLGSEINYERTQIEDTEEVVEENLSLEDMEKKMIIKALNKYKSKRKLAADDLGISERTLYRKIKQYDIDL